MNIKALLGPIFEAEAKRYGQDYKFDYGNSASKALEDETPMCAYLEERVQILESELRVSQQIISNYRKIVDELESKLKKGS